MKGMIKLLFVEDDESCAYAIQGGLELYDKYEIQLATNGQEALDIFKNFAPDVVVSDIEMPVMDGYELARAIRAIDKNVILMLATGLVMPKNVEQGYALGIDEYVKKPYIASELHMRIQAILSRISKSNKPNPVNNDVNGITIGDYVLSIDMKSLFCNGMEIQKLTQREVDIFMMLYDKKNELVNRSDILNQFWESDDPIFSSRSLDVFISKWRSYLSKDTSIKIENVRGQGLKLVLPTV